MSATRNQLFGCDFSHMEFTQRKQRVCVLSPIQLFASPCRPPGSSIHGIFPGKNTGMSCHSILQGIFLIQGSNPGFLHCRPILYHLSHEGRRTMNNKDSHWERQRGLESFLAHIGFAILYQQDVVLPVGQRWLCVCHLHIHIFCVLRQILCLLVYGSPEHELHSDLMERTVYPTRVLNLELDLVTRGDSGVVTTGRGRMCLMIRRKGSQGVGQPRNGQKQIF